MCETQVQFLVQEEPLAKGMAIHSSVLAWRIPWTEERGGLWPVGSQSRTRLSNQTATMRTSACFVAVSLPGHTCWWESEGPSAQPVSNTKVCSLSARCGFRVSGVKQPPPTAPQSLPSIRISAHHDLACGAGPGTGGDVQLLSYVQRFVTPWTAAHPEV